MTKAVTFRDYEKHSPVYEEKIVVTAAQQLEDFLNDNFYGEILMLLYSYYNHIFHIFHHELILLHIYALALLISNFHKYSDSYFIYYVYPIIYEIIHKSK